MKSKAKLYVKITSHFQKIGIPCDYQKFSNLEFHVIIKNFISMWFSHTYYKRHFNWFSHILNFSYFEKLDFMGFLFFKNWISWDFQIHFPNWNFMWFSHTYLLKKMDFHALLHVLKRFCMWLPKIWISCGSHIFSKCIENIVIFTYLYSKNST